MNSDDNDLPGRDGRREPGRVGHSVLTYVILAWFVALRAFGNLSLAWGSKHFSESLGFAPLPYVRAMLNPYIATGILLLMGSLIVRLALFSVADLTFVLPMTSIGYVISVCLGRTFFNEHISPERWVGVFLIVGATALVGSTPQNTTSPKDEQPSRCNDSERN